MSVNPFAGGGGGRQPDEIDLGDGRVIVLRQPEAGPGGWRPPQAAPPPYGRQTSPGPRWPWPLILFLATIASTLLVGGSGADGFSWSDALLYSGGIMTILLCHEFGHFLQARRYGVPASLPIFLPMPISFVGTLGALILMRPRTARTREMFDIAISGPLAGLVPTFACLLIGLPQSRLVPATPDPAALHLGEPLAVQWLVRAFFDVPAGQTLMLGPLAFAGWFGLLITALNLLPVGQLDGGHIMYTLARKKAFEISAVLLLAAALGMIVSGYWMWTLMLLLLLFFGIRHPPLADDPVPDDLGLPRKLLGWLTLIVSALLFLTPMPIQMPDL
jgi:Zn-dependent protease